MGKCTEIPAESLGNNDTASYCKDTSLLITMLKLVALEKLIQVRQSVVSEVHSEQFPVLNEFELLYKYRCGSFEECLEMCLSHMSILLRANFSNNQRFMIFTPTFFSLLDDKLLSLFGVMRLSDRMTMVFFSTVS